MSDDTKKPEATHHVHKIERHALPEVALIPITVSFTCAPDLMDEDGRIKREIADSLSDALGPSSVVEADVDEPAIWTQMGARPKLSSCECDTLRAELEEWKELAQRSADELADLRAELLSQIEALESERDKALEHARSAENARGEALKERNRAEDERDEARALIDGVRGALFHTHNQLDLATAQRDEALARASLASTSHLPIELMTLVRAAVAMVGDDEVLAASLWLRVDREGVDEVLKLSRGLV